MGPRSQLFLACQERRLWTTLASHGWYFPCGIFKAAIAAGMESYFDGVLDEVALFNFSFTAADVNLLYNGYRSLD